MIAPSIVIQVCNALNACDTRETSQYVKRKRYGYRGRASFQRTPFMHPLPRVKRREAQTMASYQDGYSRNGNGRNSTLTEAT